MPKHKRCLDPRDTYAAQGLRADFTMPDSMQACVAAAHVANAFSSYASALIGMACAEALGLACAARDRDIDH